MQRVGFAVAMSVSLTIMGSADVASAQEPCCHHHRHHPVLRAAAVAVRATVHLALAPLKLLAHHHHHGCDDCGYGYEGDLDYGPGGAPDGTEPIPPGLPPAEAAAYAPIVAPESIDSLSVDECRAAAAQAIGRGVSLYRQGEIAAAREYFHEAAVLTPDVAATWGLCGVAAAAANDQQTAAICADRVREITSNNAAERTNLYRTLAPIQGNSRVAFELLVRNTDARLPTESLVSAE